MRKTNISIEISSSDFALISNITNSSLITTIQTKSRDIFYFCLQNYSFHRAAISRLYFAANRYLCSEEELIKFTGKVWKISMLDVWEKNFFINLRTLFLKIEKSGGFNFLRMPPNVSIGKLEFEHLIFSCPSLQPSRNILQINNWRGVFVSTNIARLKYDTAVIRGAYSKSSTPWKINLQTFVSWVV